MLAVLLGAALHAAWNVIVKSSSDRTSEIALVTASAAVLAGLTLPFLPLPAAASWLYLAGSVAIHVVYFSLVALAYRHGDLSYAYPLMRGSAPLFTALVAWLIVGEHLALGGWLGIALLSTGVLTLGTDSWRSGRFRWSATLFGLANAAVIVAYTLVDGLGVRASGNALSYVQWMFFLNGFPLLTYTLIARRQAFMTVARTRWKKASVGGLCAIGSYGVALWAMAHAPIALVAALRETSVLFGTVFAALWLKERFGPARYVAALLVTLGAVAMKVL